MVKKRLTLKIGILNKHAIKTRSNREKYLQLGLKFIVLPFYDKKKNGRTLEGSHEFIMLVI